jgi:toxin ParE1/3/4
MMLRFLPSADRDLDRAIDYAVEHYPRSAGRLYRAVEAAIQRIIETPRSFPPTREEIPGVETRFFTLRRYPYNVVYVVRETEIVIVALVHHRQDSAAWLDRLPAES